MRKLLLTLILFLFVSIAFSQNGGAFSSPAAYAYGEPFANRAYKEKAGNSVEGTPNLFDDWKAGEVLLKNGEKYSIGKINMDASINKFLYLQNDTVFEFTDNVKEITIYNSGHSDNFGSDIIFRSDIDPETSDFVQVLAYGKITLFRHIDKKPEGENYSNGIVNSSRKYVLHNTDYILANNNVTLINKFSSSKLDELTSDKKVQVDAYVKANNLKLKKENDFARAITFYDTLN